MFRKSVLKAATLTAMSVSVAAIGAIPASASGYGYGSGVTRAAPHAAPAHIRDRLWQQHVEWCYGRFQTYNPYDNTYQPYTGPRRQCWSPFITG